MKMKLNIVVYYVIYSTNELIRRLWNYYFLEIFFIKKKTLKFCGFSKAFHYFAVLN